MIGADGWTISDAGYDPDTGYDCTSVSTGSTGSVAITDTGALFITTWKTDNAGSSNSTSITLPMV